MARRVYEAANFVFVQLIEQEPGLYDKSQSDYARQDKIDLVWERISHEMKESVTACKDRWKHIRTVFIRHLHAKMPSGSSATKKHPYYLYGAVQFMTPHVMKNRYQESNLPVSHTEEDTTLSEENGEDTHEWNAE